MEQANLDRINQLARLAKERPLTEDEARERESLRREYLRAFRAATKAQLDNTYILHPDGTKVKLGQKKPTQ